MSHIHIPDGVMPIWLVLAGWAATAVILYFCMRRVRDVELGRKIPLIGIVSALMILGMTLDIIPIAYHINMSVIAGIVLGPALGFISIFIVDLIISMFGHGGVTVVGLNTLIVGTEAMVGYYCFRVFLGVFGAGRLSPGMSAAVAAVLSLIISTCLMIGVVYISQINPERVLHVHKENPLGKIFSLEPEGENKRHKIEDKRIDIETFAKAVFSLGVFGWILEGVITGFVIRYVSRVRPDLVLSEVT